METSIRWQQRFSNFMKALEKLKMAVEYIQNDILKGDKDLDNHQFGNVLDEMLKEGLIQRFEYTHELAWNVMKDYAIDQGNTTIGGSKDATREAFQMHLISNGEVWMEMIKSRNETSHTYNEVTANKIYSKIINEYYPQFIAFQQTMETKRNNQQKKLW